MIITFTLDIYLSLPSAEIKFFFESFFGVFAYFFRLRHANTDATNAANMMQKKTTKRRPDVFVRVTQTVGRVLVPSAVFCRIKSQIKSGIWFEPMDILFS